MNDLLEGERIKDVKGFEGLYAVSNQGRVYSIRRKKWLKPFDTGNGYETVKLSFEGKDFDHKVHRLVGKAFVKNPNNKPQINHINGDKRDNRASNLSWVTSRENNQHACDLGLNTHYKLSKEDKRLICEMFEKCNVTKTYIARLYGLSVPGIIHVIKAYGNQEGNA